MGIALERELDVASTRIQFLAGGNTGRLLANFGPYRLHSTVDSQPAEFDCSTLTILHLEFEQRIELSTFARIGFPVHRLKQNVNCFKNCIQGVGDLLFGDCAWYPGGE